MKAKKILLIVSLAFIFLVSCNKDEDLNIITPVGLGGDSFEPTSIDQWLHDSLTVPYNIAVKYRWDPWELDVTKTLTPPDESKIIPSMSAIKKVWIEPYNDETGSDEFMKKYTPKQIKLVGSAQYDFDGTVVLGQAEGGNNIIFFDINQNFDKNSMSSIMRMIRTSHHEFGHTLHEKVMYPTDFKNLSGKAGFMGYTVTWFNVSEREAYENGYITPYSMSNSNDDFVEMISLMLTYGKTKYEEIISIVNPEAQAVFRSKEQYVVNYFKEVWNIDFYSLQARVTAALNSIAPPAAIGDAYGFGKTYTNASVDFNNLSLLPQRATFSVMMQDAAANVAAIPQFGLTLDSFAILLPSATDMILRMYIGQGGNVFFADFNYTYTLAGGVYDYTYVDANDNGTVIKDAVQTVLDYYSNNQFTVSWYKDPSVSIYPRAKFTTVASSSDYFIALLLAEPL